MKRIWGWVMVGVVVLAASAVRAQEEKKADETMMAKPTVVSTPTVKAKKSKVAKPKTVKDSYICPMCHIKSDKPGKCPQCGMDMVKEKPANQKTAPKESKPQASMKPAAKDVYVCPMCDIKSDKPGKCPHCGMDLVKETPKDPNAKVVYRCDRCGIESDKPGDCPHHCGGTLVVKE